MTSDLPSPVPGTGVEHAPKSLTFTPDQLSAMGLDCQPGQSYTLTFTCGTMDESGCQATVEDAAPSSDESADLDDVPAADSAPEEDADPLGIAHKPKAPRAGLPDTKKLREV